ncbi:MAG: GntR family transcriptional regulator [Pseudomonadota bacterium]
MDGEFKPVVKEPAYLKVCRAIEEKITDGGLAAGASLPTETELCEQFGVTRSTVREGLRLLEQTGLVMRGPAKRLFVSRPKLDDVAAATSRSLSLSGATFREVWEALMAIYPAMARLAAGRLQGGNIEALQTIREDLMALDDQDTDGVVDHAVAFFQEMANGLDNRVALAMLQSVNLMIDKSLRRMIELAPNAKLRIAEAQRRIIEAIEARNPDETEKWLSRHIADLRRGYEVAGLDMEAPVL